MIAFCEKRKLSIIRKPYKTSTDFRKNTIILFAYPVYS